MTINIKHKQLLWCNYKLQDGIHNVLTNYSTKVFQVQYMSSQYPDTFPSAAINLWTSLLYVYPNMPNDNTIYIVTCRSAPNSINCDNSNQLVIKTVPGEKIEFED